MLRCSLNISVSINGLMWERQLIAPFDFLLVLSLSPLHCTDHAPTYTIKNVAYPVTEYFMEDILAMTKLVTYAVYCFSVATFGIFCYFVFTTIIYHSLKVSSRVQTIQTTPTLYTLRRRAKWLQEGTGSRGGEGTVPAISWNSQNVPPLRDWKPEECQWEAYRP